MHSLRVCVCNNAAKFNCKIPGTIHEYSVDCPAPPTTVTATTVSVDSGTKTDGQEPIKISGEKYFINHECEDSIYNNSNYDIIVIVGGGVGSFAMLVLVLGLLCICAVVCKKKRVKGGKYYCWSRINIILMPLYLLFMHTLGKSINYQKQGT